MPPLQLQLDLWQELQAAEQSPEQTDVVQLCIGMERAIAVTPPAQKLQTAASAFLQIAEIFALRAGLLLTDWEQSYSEEGPPLEDEDLSELLRQSMSLDLEELMADPEPITRQRKPSLTDSVESVAGMVDKDTLLEAFNTEIELMEAQAGAESEVVSVAHSEDVTAWAGAIARWLQQHSSAEPVPLMELQKGVGLPLVELWLGILLGREEFMKEQRGAFYSLDIWVSSC